MKKRSIKILAASAALLILTGFYAAGDIYFEIAKNIDLFGKVFKEVSFNYVDEIDPEVFVEAGIQGMLNSLDPYTVYMDEDRNEEIDLITTGKYGGIGISVGVRGNKVTIIEVYDGYSAQRQGIRIGDVLIEANGNKITADNAKSLSAFVKGEPGTKVNVRLLRNGGKDTLVFNLMREEIIIKNVTYYGFYPEESNNVYIKLSGFSRSAGEEVRKAIKDLRTQKPIESVILDLRGNPGGLLDAAVEVSNKFLSPGKLIVSTKGRTIESEKKYFATQEAILPDVKIVLLVNESSASASEIVAGSIQDNDRGVIVGEKTFGKGLVQTVTPLTFNTSLKITTAKYYTPSGRCIQRIDYSKKDKTDGDMDTSVVTDDEYFTLNHRLVYGSGGITPDSTVKFEVEGNITRELLAKGILFGFADDFYYNNSDKKYESLSNEKLLSSFREYLKHENFKYHSEAEIQVDKLIKEIESSKIKDEFHGELETLKKQLEKIGSAELKVYEKEVLREIRAELASRYLGFEGRAKELLKNDNQFATAFEIVKNKNSYNKLLSIK